MTTVNRTNEPTPERVEAAAKAMHETRNPWFAAYGDWGAAGFEIKQAFRESARAALVAAQGAAPPVNSFDTTVERVKTGADSLRVVPVLPSSGVDEDALAEVIAEQDAAVAAIEQDECTLPGHAGCMKVKVDGELWVDHFPSERGADTDGESK